MIEVFLYKRDFSKPKQEQQNNVKHLNNSLEYTELFPFLTHVVRSDISKDGIFALKGKLSSRLGCG